MLKRIIFLFCVVGCFLFVGGKLSAQVYCPTVPDFTDLHQPWVVATTGTTGNPFQNTGVVEGRHTLITEQGGDPLTGGGLRYLPEGESKVVRLGNSMVDAESETITYHFVVDRDRPVLLLQFAVVFELPAHIPTNQPRFILEIRDSADNLLDACTRYDVYSRVGIDGFETYYWARMPILWRGWTNVGLDLSDYAGKKVKVRLQTKDCAQRAHFGYGYFTADCVPRKLTMDDCDGDSFTLKAPDGFASYQWNDGYTGSSREEAAGVGDLSLSCEITSATGCSFSMSAFVAASGRGPAADSVMWDSVCAGEPYTKGYFNLPPLDGTGTYRYEMNFYDPSDCSEGSTLTLWLTVVRRYYDREAMICQGDIYTDKDFTIPGNTPGVFFYEQPFSTETGCDSIVRLKLTVSSSFTPVSGITGTMTACAGNQVQFSVQQTEEDVRYTWGVGDDWSFNGYYASYCYTLMEGQGTSQATFQFTDNSGQTYWNEDTYVTCTRANGCGSEILYAYPSPLAASWGYATGDICEGQEIHGAGFHVPPVDSAGIYLYPQYHTTTAGCDSVIVLHLAVHKNPQVSITASDSVTCGIPVTLQANVQGSTLVDFYEWKPGLESTSSISVNPAVSTRYQVGVGTSYTVPDSSPGTTRQLQCSDSAQQTVFVSTDVPIINAVICEGERYVQNGFDVSESGQHTAIVQNASKTCDVELTLNLVVLDTNYTYRTGIITEGDVFTQWNFTVWEPGRYTQTWKNKQGCDSLVALDLKVIPLDTVLYDQVCRGERYTENGFYTDPVKNDTTCSMKISNHIGGDSTVTVYLTVNDSIVQPESLILCSGDLPYTWRDHTFPVGSVSDTIRYLGSSAITGCDSIVYLYLTVNDSIVQHEDLILCSGDLPYIWRGHTFSAGSVSDTIRYLGSSAVTGCDSIVYLYLAVNDSIVQYETLTLCSSALPYIWRGHVFPVGSVSDTIRYSGSSAVTGCDSVVYLDLTVNDSIVQYETLTLCSSALPYTWRGHVLPVGSVTDTLRYFGSSVVMGCDSIVYLFLTVNASSDILIRDTICSGSPYLNGSFSYAAVTGDKHEIKALTSSNGCDSIVELFLHVRLVYLFEVQERICEGDTCDFRGRELTAGGVYADSLKTTDGFGCDSVYRLELTVNPVYDTTVNGEVCEGDRYTEYGFDETEPGTWYRYLRSTTGCDSTIRLVLVQKPNFDGVITVTVENCADHSYLFSTGGGLMPAVLITYRWSFGDGDRSDLPEPRHQYDAPGIYRVETEVTVANGCKKTLFYDQEVVTFVEDPRIYSDRTELTDEFPEIRFWTDPADGVRFLWDFGDGSTDEGDEVTHVYDVVGDQEFTVRLQAINADSCLSEERTVVPAFLHVDPPNTFSPNDDGFYDRFMPGMRVKIVNRNGLILYEGEDGWDGTYQGKKVPGDTYFYELRYWQKGKERVKKGYITVVL